VTSGSQILLLSRGLEGIPKLGVNFFIASAPDLFCPILISEFGDKSSAFSEDFLIWFEPNFFIGEI